MKTFCHADYILGCPSNWTDSTTVILKGKPHSNFCPNVTITRQELKTPLPVNDFAAEQLRTLQDTLVDQKYERLNEGTFPLNKTDGYFCLHQFAMPDEDWMVKQLQVYAVMERHGIILTASDSDTHFNESETLFYAMFQKFEWAE